AATIWWTFWQAYIAQTFDPWWKAKKVAVDRSEVNDALGQYLESETLLGSSVCPPDGCGPAPACPAVQCAQLPLRLALQKAFNTTVATLERRLGSDPSTWTWGRVHQRVLENLALIKGLDYGPRPDRGDANTPLAAPDFPSAHGPSWRMVVDWGTGSFSGIYPGGQSENPASSWYENRVDTWWNGQYAPMLSAADAASMSGTITWRLES
ncbi:MAG TPA: penicillin acylase family protein, partial [Candidatus Dormibacteraeota bacterium]